MSFFYWSEYLSELDLSLQRSAQCWQVVWSPRMLGEFGPGVLDIVPCSEEPPVLIWHPSGKLPGAHKKADASAAGWHLTSSGDSSEDRSDAEISDADTSGSSLDMGLSIFGDDEFGEDVGAEGVGEADASESDTSSSSSSTDSEKSASELEALVAGVVGDLGPSGRRSLDVELEQRRERQRRLVEQQRRRRVFAAFTAAARGPSRRGTCDPLERVVVAGAD